MAGGWLTLASGDAVPWAIVEGLKTDSWPCTQPDLAHALEPRVLRRPFSAKVIVITEERRRRGTARSGRGARGLAAWRVSGCAVAPRGWQMRALLCATLAHFRVSEARGGDVTPRGRAPTDQACASECPTRRAKPVQAWNALKNRDLRLDAAVAVRPAGVGFGSFGQMTIAHRTLSSCATGRRSLVLAGSGSRRDLLHRCAASATQHTVRGRS